LEALGARVAVAVLHALLLRREGRPAGRWCEQRRCEQGGRHDARVSVHAILLRSVEDKTFMSPLTEYRTVRPGAIPFRMAASVAARPALPPTGLLPAPPPGLAVVA